MAGSLGKLSESVTCYTELRAAANEILKYASFASYREILETQTQSVSDLGQSKGVSAETAAVCELLLQSNEAIPLYSEMKKALDSGIALDAPSALGKSISYSSYLPYKDIFAKSGSPLTDKRVTTLYHGATTKIDAASVLSDISAMFCSMIPATEMSLCVPYFDAKIIYPSEKNKISTLSTLGFVGTSQESNTKVFDSPEVTTKLGYDVAGMEIFCSPQTLVASNDYLRSAEGIRNKGIETLDPIMPLLTIESVNFQSTGLAGTLNSQTRADMKLVLHDRSRLADIETLTSVQVYPHVTFRLTYGWAHPDTNKMSGGVYARMLNSMRVTQDFCLNSVSISARDATTMSLSLSLVSKGKNTSVNGKMISGNDEYLPNTILQSLIEQFVTTRTAAGDQKSDIAAYGKVGSKIIVGASSKSSNSKFIKIDSFYDLYNLIQQVIPDNAKTDDQKISEIVTKLSTIDTTGTVPVAEDYMVNLYRFPQASGTYGDVTAPPTLTTAGAPIMSEYLKTKVKEISDAELLASQVTDALSTDPGEYAYVVPLSKVMEKFFAKPLLVSQPEVSEVRLHFFSFNSRCGHMAKENIGNFPIVISDLVQKRVSVKKDDPFFNLRSSIDSVMTTLLAHVNNPASPYYGVSADYQKKKAAADSLKNLKTDNKEEIKAAKESAAAAIKTAEDSIDSVNAKILGEKQIFAESSFVPPQVKYSMEVLPAYETEDEKLAPQKTIIRIMVYDDKAGGFNDLGNLIFSMINANGIARINTACNEINSILSDSSDASSAFTSQKSTETSADKTTSLATYGIKDKATARRIVSNLYPTLVIGADNGMITNASFTSQPGGDLQSSFLFSALTDSDTPAGASATSEIISDIIINTSSITLTMIGNVCIAIGQTYFVDFNTGTTLDNSYTVSSVSHGLAPGKFTTTVTMNPANSASMTSLKSQLDTLILQVKNSTTELNPSKPAASK